MHPNIWILKTVGAPLMLHDRELGQVPPFPEWARLPRKWRAAHSDIALLRNYGVDGGEKSAALVCRLEGLKRKIRFFIATLCLHHTMLGPFLHGLTRPPRLPVNQSLSRSILQAHSLAWHHRPILSVVGACQ